MAPAGFGQRTIQFHLNSGNFVEINLAQKALGSAPGAHSVRTAWADTNFKDIKYRDSFHNVKTGRQKFCSFASTLK
jgi:hypothetical protein